jgi:hypothetical protein
MPCFTSIDEMLPSADCCGLLKTARYMGNNPEKLAALFQIDL